MKMKNNMEKERIEEMKKQLFYQYLQVAGFHKEAEDWVRQALTEAHQAGRDEAVEIVKGMKKELLEFPYDSGTEHLKKTAYNQALDDTIKALQDNK